jgi:type I restriction enzyme, S subunit
LRVVEVGPRGRDELAPPCAGEQERPPERRLRHARHVPVPGLLPRPGVQVRLGLSVGLFGGGEEPVDLVGRHGASGTNLVRAAGRKRRHVRDGVPADQTRLQRPREHRPQAADFEVDGSDRRALLHALLPEEEYRVDAQVPDPDVADRVDQLLREGMTPQGLIAAFDAVAEAPDGVTRLRELVIQLAVRGLLVPQDSYDEPATVLLERIRGAKSLRTNPRRARKHEVLPAGANDAPFKIPEGWCWARFTEVARIASNLVDPAEFGSEPHVAPDSIEKATGRLIGFRTIREDGMTSAKHRFSSGQILYSKIRPNLSKVVIVDFDGLCSADMYPIDSWIERGYLHRFMLSRPFLDQITSDDNRLAMPKVNQEQLSAVHVPVPPLPEQRRIVARVDELMGLLDRLEAARRTRDSTRVAVRGSALDPLREADTQAEVGIAWSRFTRRMDELVCEPADIAPLREAVLQLAVRGRLVKQDPADEPASVLVARITAEKARLIKAGKIREQKGLSPVLAKEVPFQLPTQWEWVRCQSVFAVVTDGDHLPPPKTDAGVPFLVIGDVSGGEIDFTNSRFVATDYYADLDWSRQPSRGDLLYTVTGSFGLTLSVTTNRPFCVQRHIAILKGTSVADTKYLACALSSPVARAYATEKATGTAQKTVSLAALRAMPLPLPPLAEQQRIVARVDELMALLDRLEARLTAARAAQTAFAAAAVHHLDAGATG